jgi:radical SAM superfamily enzyme YgiQ (UPF0313 family)
VAEILLTHSYFLRFDPKQWRAQQPFPPLATLYAAAVLRDKNFDVAFHDMMFASSANEIAVSIEKHHPKYLVIYDDGFNYLTKMCLTNMREAAFKMIAIGKQKNCKIIISSSDATDHSEEYLKCGADFIIVGEGEQTLLQLIEALENKTDIHLINGLRFLENDLLTQTNKRENVKDLDTLPFPAWDLADIAEYKKRWLKSSGYFSLNICTTRGCPFKCNWCAKPIYGNRYNSRSPENVVAEIKMLKEKFQFDHIWFCDDIFGLKPGWVILFSELVKKANLKIKFKIQSRVDLLLEEDNINALASAGCDEIWVGAESGSQKILDAMEKGTKVEQIYEATKLMKQKNIKPCFFLQFGYLGEQKTDIDSTLKMLFELMPYDIGVSVSYPLPGTKFYETVKDQLKTKTNWTDSDELAMMFEGTFHGGFYRKLQRHVHRQFRRKQVEQTLKQFISNPFQLTFEQIKNIPKYPFYLFSKMPAVK